MTAPSIRARVDQLPWYHSIDLGDGVVTPGEYDHRPVVPHVPLPDRLDGLRCLDVGTHDGFWAFEMERRGAAEVVAIDVEHPEEIDWPEPRLEITEELRAHVAERKSAFDVAAGALGSSVKRQWCSLYDLTPEEVGSFDLAFLGTLLHHLRDPIGALQSVRRVVDGRLVLVAVISPWKTALFPFTPLTELLEMGSDPFYELPNIAGLRRQLELGGWEVERWGRPHLQVFGEGHRPAPLQWRDRRGLRTLPRQLLYRKGVLHVSVVARPR